MDTQRGALISYCKNEFGAREFLYSTREENDASKRLAESMRFQLVGSEEKIDGRDGHHYNLLKYSLKL